MNTETNYRYLLSKCLPFINDTEKVLLRKAYILLRSEYQNRAFFNNDPLIDHMLKLTQVVVSELHLGFTSAISMLFSQTDAHKAEISDLLIENNLLDVIKIIESLKKISTLPTDRLISNVENFTGIMLTMVSDVRAILLSLAENLYLMRNASVLPVLILDNTVKKSVNIYIPLAHKLGLYYIKSELEELTLLQIQPEIYNNLAVEIDQKVVQSKDFIQRFVEPIESDLQRLGMNFTIKSRTKSVSSVYSKMVKQNVILDEVYDLFAIRIILDSPVDNEREECWKAYSVVTNLYYPEPSRMRDWITRPRANGYESLHITVREPSGKWVEVQIRTKRMDNEAELGNAAHWRYKGQTGAFDTGKWMNSVRQILESPDYKEESLLGQDIVSKLPEHTIYVFTPAGDLKKLKKGASVLDFAFELHTNIGAKCSGAKVNHKIVPIRHLLKNGDIVEIITSKNQNPNIDWLGWVASTRAKNKIKRILKEAEFKQAETGKEILRRKMGQLKMPYNDENISKLIAYFKFSSSLELFQQLAENKIEPSIIKDVLLGTVKETIEVPVKKEVPLPVNRTSENTIIVNESAELQGYILAKCCNPVIGDVIFGFVLVGGGVKVHRVTCPNANRLRSNYPYRIMNAEWSKIAEGSYFIAALHVSGIDQLGVLNSITQLLSDELKVDVRNIAFNSKGGKFEGSIKVSVRDSRHIDSLIKKIENLKGVTRVKRLV